MERQRGDIFLSILLATPHMVEPLILALDLSIPASLLAQADEVIE
jgi:hypothetical protein